MPPYRFNRRSFLAGLGLAGVTPAVFSRVSAQEGAWSPSDGLRLAGPVQGLETLDPALSRDNSTNALVRQVARGLMGYDEQLLAVPELAASVDVSADQVEYTFTLRDDAGFHDGRAIEAEDVAFSLSRALSPATSATAGFPLMGTTFLGDIAGAEEVRSGDADRLDGVEVIDTRTVHIRLQGPSTTFLMRLASVPASILDRHQDMADPHWWLAMNGSGPYRIVSVDPATEVVLRAMETWHGKDVPVRDVWVRLGMDASLPENLIQGGEIDLVDNVYPGLAPLLLDPALSLDGYQMYEQSQFGLTYIAIGGRAEPLDDVHIRRAIQLGFDVPTFVDAAHGETALVPEGIIPQGVLGRVWRGSMPARDLDAARTEIVASSYGAAERVPSIRIHATDIEPIEAMRATLARDLGLQVEPIQVNWGDFLNGLADRRWDAYSVFWSMDYPDPEALLRMLWASDSADNYTGYANDEFDALLDASRREADDIVRHDLYMEAQQMLIDDVAVIPLSVPKRYSFARPGFTYLPVTAIGLLGLERVR